MTIDDIRRTARLLDNAGCNSHIATVAVSSLARHLAEQEGGSDAEKHRRLVEVMEGLRKEGWIQ